MEKRIIFKQEDGGVGIIVPSPRTLETKTIEEIAEKDVPKGLPYRIVDVDYVPSDRTFRDAWEVDEVDLTDGVGGDHDMFIDDPEHPDYVEPDND
jgi:hypothetical protein